MSRLRDQFRKFFELSKPELQKQTDAVEWAKGYLGLWNQPAFVAVIERIRVLANREIPTTGDLAAAIGRSNGIKEVLRVLDSDRQRAQLIVDRIEGR